MSSKSAFARADNPVAGALAVAVIALATAACQHAPEMQKRIIPVFGTIVQVEIAGATTGTSDIALDRLEALYRGLDLNWRSFGPGELGRANAALARGEPVELSPPLARLVERSIRFRELSGGLFDPRVGSLVVLWGFQDMAHRTPADRPDDVAIRRTRAQSIDAAVLHQENAQLWSEAPVTLELAGIAKGSALAAGAALLQANGIGNALIVAGGDVLASGTRGDRPWRVGIRDPLSSGVLGTVDLASGEAILSSGNYERRFKSRGESFHHIIDPRTGYPSRGTAGTTVLSRDVELGNAAATALMVGGAERFEDLVRSMSLCCALLVTEKGAVLMTPGMRERVNK